MYWYIADAKVQALKNTSRKGWLSSTVAKLNVNSPVGGLELSSQSATNRIRDLRAAEGYIRSHYKLVDADLLAEDAVPTFFEFGFHAARLIQGPVLWIAGAANATAILLVGSAVNAIGGPVPRADEYTFAPSADPLSAVGALVDDDFLSDEDGPELLSLAWREVYKASRAESMVLPFVRGIAVFAGLASSPLLSNFGSRDLKRVVIGSPVYVAQQRSDFLGA